MQLDDIMADMILAEMAEGVSLSSLCRNIGVTRNDMYAWRDRDEANGKRFEQARLDGHDAIADDCKDIADDKTEDPKSRRVRIQTRMQLLAAWDKRYNPSSKLQVDATVRQTSVTMPPETLSDQDAASFYQNFMKSDGA